MVPQWIDFRIEDGSKVLHNSGFPGNSKQRRKLLRAKIRQLNKGRELYVSKRTYKKGASASTASIDWRKTIPAS